MQSKNPSSSDSRKSPEFSDYPQPQVFLQSSDSSKSPDLPDNLSGVHFHFVGIKGTGMAALVEIFFHNGAVITGSDVSERFYTDEILEKLGIKPLPFREKNITDNVQFVVYSSAYNPGQNPDLIEAKKRKIPCLLYTEALGLYSARSYSCGIAGVHGKTSTTGLAGTILKELPLPSQVLAGSVINSFGSSCTFTSPLAKNLKNPKNKIFVAETCEYQKHFMSFFPQKIVLTSVESDHEDFYPAYEDIRDAFVEYICRLPENGQLIYCADDKGASEAAKLASEKRKDIILVPYGENASGDYRISFGKVGNEKNPFSVKLFENPGISKAEKPEKNVFYLKMPGRHEVLDAVAAVALCSEILKTFGKNPSDYYENIKKGLSGFSGGKRRSEIVGNAASGNSDIIFIDDYAHHPTAIKTTLEGFRSFYSGRKIIVDFMSHTYSRTEALLDEFSKSFFSADCVILHKIYSSARENPSDFKITGRTLFEETKKHFRNVHYFEEILDAKDFVLEELEKPLSPEFPNGYLFVTMGAGDNWKIGKEVLQELKKGKDKS